MKKEYISKRSFARFFAIQILFSYFYDKNDSITDLKTFLENYYISDEFSAYGLDYKTKVDMDFLDNILIGSVKYNDLIINDLQQKIIGKYSFDDLDDIIKIILILATYEFKYTNTDKKIIINEYVDISAEYFTQKQVSFINAILDLISK